MIDTADISSGERIEIEAGKIVIALERGGLLIEGSASGRIVPTGIHGGDPASEDLVPILAD